MQEMFVGRTTRSTRTWFNAKPQSLTRISRLEPFGKRRKEFGETEGRKAEREGANESIIANSNALKIPRGLNQSARRWCAGGRAQAPTPGKRPTK